MNIALKVLRFLRRYDIPQLLIGVKILLALLLIGCLFNVSRDYLRIVRYVVFVMSVWVAYVEFSKGGFVAGAASVITAIMLNPVIPFFLPQYQWKLFYAALAVALIVWSTYELYVVATTKKVTGRYDD